MFRLIANAKIRTPGGNQPKNWQIRSLATCTGGTVWFLLKGTRLKQKKVMRTL